MNAGISNMEGPRKLSPSIGAWTPETGLAEPRGNEVMIPVQIMRIMHHALIACNASWTNQRSPSGHHNCGCHAGNRQGQRDHIKQHDK